MPTIGDILGVHQLIESVRLKESRKPKQGPAISNWSLKLGQNLARKCYFEKAVDPRFYERLTEQVDDCGEFMKLLPSLLRGAKNFSRLQVSDSIVPPSWSCGDIRICRNQPALIVDGHRIGALYCVISAILRLRSEVGLSVYLENANL